MRSLNRGHERGMTLYVVLVMLAGLGLMAAMGLRSGQTNLKAVGNMQSRQEAMSAAQAAIERTISSPEFSERPAAVAAAPLTIDLDGDGRADETVQITPQPSCYNYRIVLMNELDADVAADRVCMRGTSGMPTGIESAVSANSDSMCADSEWHVRAAVESPQSGAQAVVNQGIAMRGAITDAANNCP
jgi:hypothetical protein